MTQTVVLNPELLKKQMISKRTQKWLISSHKIKVEIFNAMQATDDPVALKALAKIETALELHQQELWGFEPNENAHYWWKVPKCRCPKMDNAERYGTPYGIISATCPVHGCETK